MVEVFIARFSENGQSRHSEQCKTVLPHEVVFHLARVYSTVYSFTAHDAFF